MKKKFLIPTGIILAIGIFIGTTTTPVLATTHHAVIVHKITVKKKLAPVIGKSVHSPAYADKVPAGASARCGDGTYSFSQSHRGTCSHHGGVSGWL